MSDIGGSVSDSVRANQAMKMAAGTPGGGQSMLSKVGLISGPLPQVLGSTLPGLTSVASINVGQLAPPTPGSALKTGVIGRGGPE